jgi:hypothetical protein
MSDVPQARLRAGPAVSDGSDLQIEETIGQDGLLVRIEIAMISRIPFWYLFGRLRQATTEACEARFIRNGPGNGLQVT